MTWYRYLIVETDNRGGDYPDESFVSLPLLCEDDAKAIAEAINNRLCTHDGSPRYWKIVENGYTLAPGFEP